MATLSMPLVLLSLLALGEPDLTPRVERLGIPSARRYEKDELLYARNVWDLHVFDGRLYVGSGNSNNDGPAPNAGPVDVWVLDPRRGRFEVEATLQDCQIDRFREIGGKLYIPGHDPLESWELGNYYLREGDRWVQHRTIPGGIHVYDLHEFEGRLHAAIGANKRVEGSRTIVVSEDGGKSWKAASDASGRIYTLFELEGGLYGCAATSVWGRKGDRFEFLGLTKDLLSDGTAGGRVARWLTFEGRLVCILGEKTSDHQWFPSQGFVVRSLDLPSERIGVKGLPFDVLERDGACWMLSNQRIGPEQAEEGTPSCWVRVHASFDLETWHPVLEFRSGTFARSFEILDGGFFFGLGSHIDRPHPDTGMILRLRGEHVKPALARMQAKEAAAVAHMAGVDAKDLASIDEKISAAASEWERGHTARAQTAYDRALSVVRDALGVRQFEPLRLSMESSRVEIGKPVSFGLRVRGKQPRREALASIEIQDAGGRRLRFLEVSSGKAPTGPWTSTFLWDGTTDQGLPVPEGEVRLLGRMAVDGRPLLPVRGSVLVASP